MVHRAVSAIGVLAWVVAHADTGYTACNTVSLLSTTPDSGHVVELATWSPYAKVTPGQVYMSFPHTLLPQRLGH